MGSLIFTVLLMFNFQAWAETDASTAVTAASVVEQLDGNLSQMQNCMDFQAQEGQGIYPFCGGNPMYEEAQRKQQSCAILNKQSEGTGEAGKFGIKGLAQNANQCVIQARLALRKSTAYCKKAVTQCQKSCKRQFDQANQQYTQQAQLVQAGQATPDTLEPFNEQMNQAQAIADNCNAQIQETEAKAVSFDMENLAPLLSGTAAILAAVKGNNMAKTPKVASLPTALTDEDDKCNGEFADVLIECQDSKYEPSSNRASLNGSGNSLVGKPTGLSLASLGEGAESGIPGGTSKERGQGSGSGANGFGAAGLGGGGLGSASGGSSEEGASEVGSDLDTDIHKGSFGSLGGGGGSGGAAIASKPSSFSGGKLSSFRSGASVAGVAALQKKLNKYNLSKTPNRAPASKGSANGPFDSNWSVINKAYKKNSSSLYHQQ